MGSDVFNLYVCKKTWSGILTLANQSEKLRKFKNVA